MNYTSLNFSLDVILIGVALLFLIRDYPKRTVLLTLMCILSYLVPLTFVENWLEPKKTETAQQTESKQKTPGDPATEAQAAAQRFTQANPVTTGANMISLWNSVLNGLSSMNGGGSGDSEALRQQVEERMGGSSVLTRGEATEKESGLINTVEQKFLARRLGTHLSVRETKQVEMFWFLARCCLLAGAAYFILIDWKITMSIVGMCVIPVHYYIVLMIYLLGNWQKTQPYWGIIGMSLMGVAAFVAVANMAWRWHGRRQEQSFEIPNPYYYHARMNGTDYEYQILGHTIQLAGLTLDLGLSYLDPKDHSRLRFQSGAAIQFIRKEGVPMPEPVGESPAPAA